MNLLKKQISMLNYIKKKYEINLVCTYVLI